MIGILKQQSALATAARILTVAAKANGLRVDRYLREQTQASSSLLFKLLRKKSIVQIETTQAKKLQGSDRVFPGMQIRIPSSLQLSLTINDRNQHSQTSSQKLQFLFKSATIAVLQKPYGLACQGGTGVRSSVDTFLPAEYRLVHRLDRYTTGALVVAKSRLAAAALTKAFRERLVDKTYIALLNGIPSRKSGMINRALVNNGQNVCLADQADDNGAKEAVTKYKVLKTGIWREQQVSLVELDILTGRKHQIRVHCAKVLGCPVLGDSRYSAVDEKTRGNMYLHLFRIKVPNVVDEQDTKLSASRTTRVSVTAPFPLFWQQAFSTLGIKYKS